MGTASNSTSGGVNGGLGHWNSPVPYLFGGLGAMLGLIAIALIILACSYRRSSMNSSGSDHHDQGESVKQVVDMQLEMEPKIVVIMAGDDNPTYLAKPASASASVCTCHQTRFNSTHLTSLPIA
ncbi:protein GLUTAMINE DUMPER 2-like [Mangifera indica]|uniref:protein GLUTAMINE DUMPER 2-like n=1 Tax=Mangifera indica TaxID=29780 RepID=UPI001CFA1657|nr:protein GLUTAMINE DUMPER 2-like [Mangifera indica]XP_044478993.1 protein GLUTAMINE DUMPER 2-like [Mangifera indica]